MSEMLATQMAIAQSEEVTNDSETTCNGKRFLKQQQIDSITIVQAYKC